MQCNNPFKLDESGVFVACGKCMACRIAKTREWSQRMMHEASGYDENVFVTLTYRDDRLPDNMELEKGVLQLFIKRLRKRLGDRIIRYYACGEYGKESGRPHYHAIIFGLGFCGTCRVCNKRMPTVSPIKGTDCEILETAWNLGIVYSGSVTSQSTRYVAKYMQKKLYGTVAGIKQQPFSLMSKGIGRDYVDKNADQLRKNVCLTHNEVKTGLPRYYANRLKIMPCVLKRRSNERLEEQRRHYVGKYGDVDEVWQKVKDSRLQKEKNLKKKEWLRNEKSNVRSIR